MNPLPQDPIVAISSAPGRAERGMVRISGDALAAWLTSELQVRLEPRVVTACGIDLGGPRLPVQMIWFPGPRSFTGQDVLEILVPGNPALLNRLVDHLLDGLRRHGRAGRLAEPGEFTQRAFMAGRIDLTQAEGIAATIGAESDAQLAAARHLRGGELGRWTTHVMDGLARLLALVEAGIDFTDQDDVVPITPAALKEGLSTAERSIAGLLESSRCWSDVGALPRVVLAGPPNAGKSTLFNALLGRERAVTSADAGTTRDVLAEPLVLDLDDGSRGEVLLIDLAGLEAAGTDPLDAQMQHQAQAAVVSADLLIWVRAPDDAGDHRMSCPEVSAPVLQIETKSDLSEPRGETILRVSVRTGDGMDALRQAMLHQLARQPVHLAGQTLVLHDRHRRALGDAAASVGMALALLEGQVEAAVLSDAELIADPMRLALDHLATLGGRMTPDDVIGLVFATFCIGK